MTQMQNLRVPGWKTEGSKWDDFDQFPRAIRDAMNYSMVKYSTNSIKHMLIKGYTIEYIIAAIQRKDAEAAGIFVEVREAEDLLKSIGL